MMEKKFIPDTSFVFRFVHPTCWTAEGRPMSGVMSDPEMSVEWDKYSTLAETAKRASSNHGAAALSVSFLRSLEINQRVEHDPLQANPAHSNVIGDKPAAIARKIAKHVIAARTYRPPAQ